MRDRQSSQVSLATIGRQWGRIGCLGFGGPPAHITMLRRLCVTDETWLAAREFDDAIAAASLLPGPLSTQMAIWCAWRLRGAKGALVGGMAFIAPGLVAIMTLAAVFLSGRPPMWVLGAAAGAAAIVPALALNAAAKLLPASWSRARPATSTRLRWLSYVAAGALTSAFGGAWVVVALAACGLIEAAVRWSPRSRLGTGTMGLLAVPLVAPALEAIAGPAVAAGGVLALAWVAFKVGALAFGGGFVIVPLMQHDAVSRYHWMTAAQFLDAVALGQITPGPLTQTVAVVGYAAAGVIGGLAAAAVAFAPSFAFVLGGGRSFDRIRASRSAQAFLAGAGPAAIGAIAGATVPLAVALQYRWQAAILVAAMSLLAVRRRWAPLWILAGAAAGVGAALLGAPIPH